MTNSRKAIFFDRDGVLNKERKDYVKTISELEIFPHIVEPIKKFNEKGFLVVVITNQSAINRGLTTDQNVFDIHEQIQIFLKKNEAHIDRFYYCPHKPEEDCVCRKPKPGLILKAADDLQINLKTSWFIGDSETDIQAATAADCKSFKINSSYELEDITQKILDLDIA